MASEPEDLARLQVLRRVAEIANAAETAAEAAAGCIDLVCDLTGWEVGHLLLVDGAGELVSTPVWRGAGLDRCAPLVAATDEATFVPGEGLPGVALRTGQPVSVTDVHAGLAGLADAPLPRAAVASACGVTAAFAFPVAVHGEVLGVVELFASDPDPPGPALQEVLGQVGAQLGRVVERERAAAALAVSEERARAVVEAAGDAFVAMDADGRITAWNAAAEATFGWRRDEVLGQEVAEVIVPPRYRNAHRAGVQRFLAGTPGPLIGRRVELSALHRDGHEFPVELAVWAVEEPGDRWSFSAFVTDITERRVAERELQLAYERERDMVAQLTQLDRDKADFMSMVSHELRTPLTSIIGYVDLLAAGHGGPLSEQHREMLEVIERNAHRILDLIDDIVTLDRLESGRLPIEPGTVEVAQLVEQVLDSVAPLAAARGQRVVPDVRPTAGTVVGDAAQLERVLLNLTTNAVKFTPRGGAVNIVADGDDERVQLTVVDTGMGIPADEQHRVFTRFFRSSAARAASIPGTGLGLVIAKSIVDAHCGSIELVSAEGEGTVVTVTLPRTQSKAT
jgi:PAS domain S-box-containing protein